MGIRLLKMKKYTLILLLIVVFFSINFLCAFASSTQTTGGPDLMGKLDTIDKPIKIPLNILYSSFKEYCESKCSNLVNKYEKCDFIQLNDLLSEEEKGKDNAAEIAINNLNTKCPLEDYFREDSPDSFSDKGWCCYGPKNPPPPPTPPPTPGKSCGDITSGKCINGPACEDENYPDFTPISDPDSGGRWFCCCKKSDIPDILLQCSGKIKVNDKEEDSTSFCVKGSECCEGAPKCCKSKELCSIDEGYFACCPEGTEGCGKNCCSRTGLPRFKCNKETKTCELEEDRT